MLINDNTNRGEEISGENVQAELVNDFQASRNVVPTARTKKPTNNRI